MVNLKYLAASLSLYSSVLLADMIPASVCQEVKSSHLNPETMAILGDRETRYLYKIKGNELFISEPGRVEYLYNTIEELEYKRYIAGHKILLFLDKDYTELLSVHVNEYEVNILKFHCVRI